MERQKTSTALIAAAAALLAVPLFTAQAAHAEPARQETSGRVHLEARGGSASTVTFDVTDGTRHQAEEVGTGGEAAAEVDSLHHQASSVPAAPDSRASTRGR